MDIVTGERADVLLVPINAVFDRQGMPVCYVITRTGVQTRPVQLGESSETEVEVMAGVNEGELLVQRHRTQRTFSVVVRASPSSPSSWAASAS